MVPASITQTRTCHPPLSTCPGSVGGGCCPPGFACGHKDCVAINPDKDGNDVSVSGSVTISASHTKVAKVTDVDIAAQFTPGVTDTPKVEKDDSKKVVLIGAVCGGVAAMLLLVFVGVTWVQIRKRGNTDVPQGVMTGHAFLPDRPEQQQPRWAIMGGWRGSDMQKQQEMKMRQQEPVFDAQSGQYVMRESQQSIPEQQMWPLPPGGLQQMRRVKTFPPRRAPQRQEMPQKPMEEVMEVLKKEPMEVIAEMPGEPDYDSASQSTAPMLVVEVEGQVEIPKRTLSSPEDGGRGRLWGPLTMRNP